MRATIGTFLTFIWLTAPGGPLGNAGATAQSRINAFLEDVKTDHLAVKFIRLDIKKGTPPLGAFEPDPRYRSRPPAELQGTCCHDLVRSTLLKVLHAVAPTLPPVFHPDYCIVYTDSATAQTKVLWIDSAPGEFQMRFYASDGTTDVAGIRNETSSAGLSSVGNLFEFAVAPTSGCQQICGVISAIGSGNLQFNLISVNPKKATTLAGHQPWTILGEPLPIPNQAVRNDILDAITGSIIPPPAHPPRDFRPRLGLSVRITTPPPGCGLTPGTYILLISFECERMKLLDGTEQEITNCPINRLGGEQTLNEILASAGRPLKPPTPPSS
jgi:hypothetical protein